MEDKSLFTNNQPHTISEGLQNFIDSMVEEIVLGGRAFDTQKKWLRKYVENEGVDYEVLEKNLVLFFETVDEFKRLNTRSAKMLLEIQAKDCFISAVALSAIRTFLDIENKSEEIQIRRPQIPQLVKTIEKLAILVLDGSCSMDELTVGHISKADAVSMAVNELFERMKKSRIGINYSFAIVAYDHRSEVKMQITETKNLDDRGDYNPMKGLGGGACISEGLKEAKMIAKDFLSESKMGGLWRYVTVIIMSDGIDMKPGEAISLANSLKQMPQVQIASCFIETLGTDAGLLQERADFLESLCSSNFSCMDLNCYDLFRCFLRS